jgi:hypothetical protein
MNQIPGYEVTGAPADMAIPKLLASNNLPVDHYLSCG